MNLKGVKGEQFQELTGQQICCMNREDFALKDPVNGDVFFSSLHHLLSKSECVSYTFFQRCLKDFSKGVDN